MKICIRLRKDKDKGLIDWYNSLPDGDKSRIIRNILKKNTDQEMDYYFPQPQRKVLQSRKQDDINLDNIDFEEEEKNCTKEEAENKLNNLIDSF
ncbi:MAG: hypothetical protein ACOCRO_01380 [Halanaerobiales bacterium]